MSRSPLRTFSSLLAIAAMAGACTSAGAPTSGLTYAPTLAPATQAPSPATVATPSAAPSAGANTIALSEWKVETATTYKAGTTTFTISNDGTIPHELLVFKSDLAPSAYPTDAAGDIKEEAKGIDLLSDGDNIDPGGSQSRAVDLTPGTYLFVCNIPGHFKAGMFTVVTVTP